MEPPARDDAVPVPAASIDAERVAGHWLLARLGKTVLRPGGVETTNQLLDALRISGDDDEGLIPVPAPGVYTYRASGAEEVELGPLPAQTRDLPDAVTAIVVDLDRRCWMITVNFFAEHTEDNRYCIARDGTVMDGGHTKRQRIGALAPTATMACDPAVVIDPERATVDLDCGLTLDGGPASISADLHGTATRMPTQILAVAGTEIEVTPLRIVYDVSGDLSGRWVETQWLTAEHLPVRIERDLALDGPVTFTEHSELDLSALAPTTLNIRPALRPRRAAPQPTIGSFVHRIDVRDNTTMKRTTPAMRSPACSFGWVGRSPSEWLP